MIGVLVAVFAAYIAYMGLQTDRQRMVKVLIKKNIITFKKNLIGGISLITGVALPLVVRYSKVDMNYLSTYGSYVLSIMLIAFGVSFMVGRYFYIRSLKNHNQTYDEIINLKNEVLEIQKLNSKFPEKKLDFLNYLERNK